MATTTKRVHLALTKDDVKEIDILCEHFGETKSQVIKRALILLSYITFTKKTKD